MVSSGGLDKDTHQFIGPVRLVHAAGRVQTLDVGSEAADEEIGAHIALALALALDGDDASRFAYEVVSCSWLSQDLIRATTSGS